jgi:hypothetical protein
MSYHVDTSSLESFTAYTIDNNSVNIQTIPSEKKLINLPHRITTKKAKKIQYKPNIALDTLYSDCFSTTTTTTATTSSLSTMSGVTSVSSVDTNDTIEKQKKMNRTKHRQNDGLYSSEDTSSAITETSNQSLNIKKSKSVTRSRLIRLILKEDTEKLRFELKNVDLINVRDKHKNNLMHIAAGFGRTKSVQIILKQCPTIVDQIDDKGHSPIDLAIKVFNNYLLFFNFKFVIN